MANCEGAACLMVGVWFKCISVDCVWCVVCDVYDLCLTGYDVWVSCIREGKKLNHSFGLPFHLTTT
jgi:hypothetical protein